MDSRILSQVLADYEARREMNQQEEIRRREEIEEKLPQVYMLMQRRHEMVLSSVRGIFTAGVTSPPEKIMAEYNQKIANLLKAANYPADYLSPVFTCPQCEDTGYIYENSLKKPCPCLERAYRNALAQAEERAALEKNFINFDLKRFPDEPLPDTDVTHRHYMNIVKEKCHEFADGVPDGSKKTLLLHGCSGLGKTYLLHCVANAVRHRGLVPKYVTAYDLLIDLKNAYFSREGEGAREYFDTPLLLIDDLGMEPLIENITVEQIYNLLNARLTKGLPTAISTNLSLTELQRRYTERVTSRLLDTRTGMAIPFLGKDIRLIRE